MKQLKIMIIMAIAIFCLSSCKKDKNPNPVVTTGSVSITMTNTAGNQLLAFNKYYIDANGDSILIKKFNYYMSNIVLTNSQGKTFTEPNSYHLVQQEVSSSWNYEIPNVPPGNYTSMTFLIGVDSTRNVSGAQTGALDPLNAMFWDWNQGYIMAKMEGTSPQSGSVDATFTFHIGGFSGANSALRAVTLTFAQPLLVSVGGKGLAYIHADALAWLKSPHLININKTFFTMSISATSKNIADNYANMYGVDSVKSIIL